MRFAVPLESSIVSSSIDAKFARSAYYALIDSNLGIYSIVANPFLKNTNHVGYKIFNLLTRDHKIECFIAFELGLKMQQMANKANIQLVILNNADSSLSDILGKMKTNRINKWKRSTEFYTMKQTEN